MTASVVRENHAMIDSSVVPMVVYGCASSTVLFSAQAVAGVHRGGEGAGVTLALAVCDAAKWGWYATKRTPTARATS